MSSHWRRMLNMARFRSIIARLASIVAGSFFFEPLKLHLESPDLLIEFSLLCFLLPLLLSARPGEQAGATLQQLLLPLADLVRMYLILTGQLVDRLGALGRFPRDPEVETGAES